MYDELIKALRDPAHSLDCEFCDSRYCHPDRKGYGKCIIIKAADAIENMSEAYSKLSRHMDDLAALMPRWIPVTERKPKTDDIVIVAIHDDSGDTPYDVTNVGFYLDVFPLGIWAVEDERCNYVTHWMPLPEPPKEE